MNLFTRFQKLQSRNTRYYGEILDKSDFYILVQIIGGGTISAFISSNLSIGDRCWLEYDGRVWSAESAPTMTDVGVVEV